MNRAQKQDIHHNFKPFHNINFNKVFICSMFEVSKW